MLKSHFKIPEIKSFIPEPHHFKISRPASAKRTATTEILSIFKTKNPLILNLKPHPFCQPSHSEPSFTAPWLQGKQCSSEVKIPTEGLPPDGPATHLLMTKPIT